MIRHPLHTFALFATVIGGRIQIHDHLRARLDGVGDRRIDPDVLTNTHPDGDPLNLYDAGPISGAEVTLLIEHLVVGEFAFAILGPEFSPVQHTRAVVERALPRHRIPEHDPGGAWQFAV